MQDRVLDERYPETGSMMYFGIELEVAACKELMRLDLQALLLGTVPVHVFI